MTNIPSAEGQSAPPTTYKRPGLIMLGLYLGCFTGLFSETALNIAIPHITSDFGITVGLSQWLVVGYMLVIGIVLPFTSLLLKRFSVRSLTFTALLVFLAGSLLAAAAPSFLLLLAGRMLQGICTGLLLPMLFAVTMRVYPPQRLGQAMGMAALIILFAPAVGPTLAGILVQAASWRAIFVTVSLVLLVAFVVALKFLVNPYELSKPRIDLLSALTSVLGFGGIVLGTSFAAEFGISSPIVLVALGVGVLALVVYVVRQLRMTQPLLDLRVFGYRAFTLGTVLVVLNFGITLSVMYVIPQYLQNAAGLPAAVAGMLLLPGGVVNAAVAYGAGMAYDRVGPKLLVRVGFAVSLIGLLVILWAASAGVVPVLVLGTVVLMVGVPFAMSPAQSSALQVLPGKLSADGSTVVNTLQQVGAALCTAVATLLLQSGAAGGTHESGGEAAAFQQGAVVSFVFPVALAVLGLVLSMFIRTGKPQLAAHTSKVQAQ